LFVGAVTLLTLSLFGLIPAIRATHWRLSGTLAENSASVAGRSSFGRLMLGGQLALSFSLLVAASLLSRSLYDLRTFDAGFRREHLLLISPDMSRLVPKAADQLRYTEEILTWIRNLAGVRSASASVIVPMDGTSWQTDFTAPGYVAREGSGYHSYENVVGPDFFRTLGTRLLMGREFTERDGKNDPVVAVVNESFAQRYWQNENPLGKQFHPVDKKEFITVVGVVQDATYRDFRKGAPPVVYLPLRQVPSLGGWSLRLEVWTYGEPHSLIAPVRDILTRQLKDVPATFQAFTELIDDKLLYERMLTALSVSFGGLGILICAVGIYGVAAYSVSRRTAEIGIRMALGATPGVVLRLVLREQLILVIAGLSAGALGALLATRFLRAWLFGVSPTDVPTLIGSMLCLGIITMLATSIPARRAAGIEPLQALRHQ
jgi:predicted permease